MLIPSTTRSLSIPASTGIISSTWFSGKYIDGNITNSRNAVSKVENRLFLTMRRESNLRRTRGRKKFTIGKVITPVNRNALPKFTIFNITGDMKNPVSRVIRA
jgi:hypothetical protein